MEPRRRPMGMPMDMMNAVVDYQMNDKLIPLQSPEKQIELANKRLLQRERRLEKTEKFVLDQLKEKSEKFGEIEEALNEKGNLKPFLAVEIQIPNLTNSHEDQQKMFGVAIKSLAITRGQLRKTQEENLILNNQLQNLQSALKAKKNRKDPFLDELGKKTTAYAANPNHHRYDKYKNQSSYERNKK